MSRATEPPDLLGALHSLRRGRWIDLTHAFAPGIPHYAGFPDEHREQLSDYADGGFRTDLYSLVGQWAPTSTRRRTSIRQGRRSTRSR